MGHAIAQSTRPTHEERVQALLGATIDGLLGCAKRTGPSGWLRVSEEEKGVLGLWLKWAIGPQNRGPHKG